MYIPYNVSQHAMLMLLTTIQRAIQHKYDMDQYRMCVSSKSNVMGEWACWQEEHLSTISY